MDRNMRFINSRFLFTQDKGLIVRGHNGYLIRYFGGKDLIVLNNKVFIYSKGAYFTFLKMLSDCFSGVISGYFLELKFVGLGYRFIKLDNYILIKVGQSHYAKLVLSKDVHVIGYKKRLIFFGLSIIVVKRLVDFVRSLRLPDSYKGKGILYLGEEVVLKVGKQK
tara:strand:+ start:31 stop:525 length:495 start_codon:yes stop_codon:yes gene_type:complete